MLPASWESFTSFFILGHYPYILMHPCVKLRGLFVGVSGDRWVWSFVTGVLPMVVVIYGC